MSFLLTLNDFKIFEKYVFHPVNSSTMSFYAESHGQLWCGQYATTVNLTAILKRNFIFYENNLQLLSIIIIY